MGALSPLPSTAGSPVHLCNVKKSATHHLVWKTVSFRSGVSGLLVVKNVAAAPDLNHVRFCRQPKKVGNATVFNKWVVVMNSRVHAIAKLPHGVHLGAAASLVVEVPRFKGGMLWLKKRMVADLVE